MKTLSEFIREKREQVGLTPAALAKKCNVELDVIEKLEAAEELFLPVTIRQNLAKGLKCLPSEIKEYEKVMIPDAVSFNTSEKLKSQILNDEKQLSCPKCGSPLVVRLEKMYDLQDNLVLEPKAHCSKCIFQLK